jgi:peptide/nickel transport system substrate-binding protein
LSGALAEDKEFVVRANPNYYRGVADIERVNVQRVAQSSQRMVLLRSGDAQLVDKLTPREFDSLGNAKGIRVASALSNSTLFMLMNWKKAPWQNIKLREAVAHAIPYDSIIRNVYFGKSKKYDGVVSSAYPGHYTPAEPRNFDITRAKAELAAAGFPDGKGLEPYADSFKLTYATESESVLGPAATIIQSGLKQIGLPVVLNPIPLAQLLDRALVRRDLEFVLVDFSKSIGMDSAFAIQLYYLTKEKGGVANYSLYSNPMVDDLFLNQAKTEAREPTRTELLQRIQKLAYDDVANISITENVLQWAMTDRLSGVGFHPDQALRLFDLKLAN